MKMVLAAAVMALAAFTAAHSATVVNGSFEDASTSPTYGNGAYYMTDGAGGSINSYGYGNTPYGNAAGVIFSGYSLTTGAVSGSISFALTDLVVGQSYSISFADALSNAAYAANPFTISYGALQLGSFAANSTNWTSATTGLFNATGTTGTLTFTGSAVAPGGAIRSVGIDAVSIAAGSAAAVPEPAGWLMMICGFGLVGGALRRRRAVPSLA